jgi:hypothetical protein
MREEEGGREGEWKLLPAERIFNFATLSNSLSFAVDCWVNMARRDASWGRIMYMSLISVCSNVKRK